MASDRVSLDNVSRASRACSAKQAVPGPRESLADISQKLAGIIEDISRLGPSCESCIHHSEPEVISKLRDAILVRTLRNRLFPKGLFSDPAWDMVLDLTLAGLEHRRISVSSLCIASNVPTTTALRCIKALIEHGIVQIVADTSDRRRKIVELSRDTRERMTKLASSIL